MRTYEIGAQLSKPRIAILKQIIIMCWTHDLSVLEYGIIETRRMAMDEFKIYVCDVCGWEYNEEDGCPRNISRCECGYLEAVYF